MEKVFIIIFYALLFMGCDEWTNNQKKSLPAPSTQDLPVIDIGRDFGNVEEFRLDEIATDIAYIKLEKTPESIVGGDNTAWYVTKEFIFAYTMSRLLQFDRNGNFIKQIGRDGRGPGEIPVLIGLALSESDDVLYVMGNWNHNVYKFNVNTGEFLGDFPINGYLGVAGMETKAFQMIDNKTFIALSHFLTQFSPDYLLYEIFDDQGNILGRRKSPIHSVQKDIRSLWGTLAGATQMWTFEGNLRLFEDLNDTVYNIINNQLEPVFVFRLGKYGGSIDNMAMKRIDQDNSFVRINGIWETPDHIFINFYHKGELRIGRFNKTTNKFSQMIGEGEMTKIINDIDGGLPFWPWGIENNEDNEWVTFFDAIEMKQQLTEEWFQTSEVTYPEKKEQLEKFVSDLSDDDNPVVMVVKLK